MKFDKVLFGPHNTDIYTTPALPYSLRLDRPKQIGAGGDGPGEGLFFFNLY